jgi:protein YIPF1/2
VTLQILCVIPVPLLRWSLVGLAFLFSGYFLVANIYPILASVSHLLQILLLATHVVVWQAEQKATRLLVIILVILHAALALTFKVLFFSYDVVQEIGVKDPLGSEGPGAASSVVTNATAVLM